MEESESPLLQEFTNCLGMRLNMIPAGTFTMGSPPDELDSQNDERQHQVTISRPFYIGVYQVTQRQYRQVMGVNPSRNQGDVIAELHPKTRRVVRELDSDNHPVDTVSWPDAMTFCRRLTDSCTDVPRMLYRLPTEAEWEYACRAGTVTPFNNGVCEKEIWKQVPEYRPLPRTRKFLAPDDRRKRKARQLLIGDCAWTSYIRPFAENETLADRFDEERRWNRSSHPVGGKAPNAWGLYDMHGNVHEWCMDFYGEYPRDAVIDPAGPTTGSSRVTRGGSYLTLDSRPCDARSAARTKREIYSSRDDRSADDIGFRIVGTPLPPQSPNAFTIYWREFLKIFSR